MFGLSLDEVPVEEIMIWDINYDSFNLFSNLDTQWRVGPAGRTGLDYNCIPIVGKMLGYKKKDINAMFPDIRVMENEALITIMEAQENANNSGTSG